MQAQNPNQGFIPDSQELENIKVEFLRETTFEFDSNVLPRDVEGEVNPDDIC